MAFTLDDLCRPFEIVTLPNGRKVRVRALSDTELRARDLEATRVSALMMEALKDTESREYQSIVLPILQSEAEAMRQALLAYKSIEAARQAQSDIQPEFVPFPENASEQEKREVVLAQEAKMAEVAEKRKAQVERAVETEKTVLAEKNDDELRHLVRLRSISGVADAAWTEEFIVQTIYKACEGEDGLAPFFTGPTQVKALPRQVRQFLWEKYGEVDKVDPFLSASPSLGESSME